jgi:hypothetical protein
VRARPAAVVRLEGALALAHGRLSRSTARLDAGRRSAGAGRWCVTMVRWSCPAAIPQDGDRAGPRWYSAAADGDTAVGGHG